MFILVSRQGKKSKGLLQVGKIWCNPEGRKGNGPLKDIYWEYEILYEMKMGGIVDIIGIIVGIIGIIVGLAGIGKGGVMVKEDEPGSGCSLIVIAVIDMTVLISVFVATGNPWLAILAGIFGPFVAIGWLIYMALNWG